MEYKVETVPVYRVKGDRKTYRSYRALVNRLAWLVVFEKYGDTFSIDENCLADIYPISEPKFSGVCDCHSKKYSPYGYKPTEEGDNCPIHDRKTGYLRRLHDRYVRLYIVAYPMPKLAEFPNDVS